MRLAFDCAAFLWNALLYSHDKEGGRKVTFNDKEVWVNGHVHGYDLTMDHMLEAMKRFECTPHQCILVFEGLHSKKLRQAIDPLYKNTPDTRPPEAYEEYAKARDMLEAAWKSVGAIAMSQPFAEGDDVLGYLARNAEQDLVIATYDNDLLVLAGKNQYGCDVDVCVKGLINENKYGRFPLKYITLYKSLVGDQSDNIKGCPGFGVKAWEGFYLGYDDAGLEYLDNALKAGALGEIHRQRDDDALIRKICDNEAQIIKSYRCAQIHDEWVNTLTRALDIRPGMCLPAEQQKDERLVEYAGKSWLVTRGNFAERAAFFRSQINASPFIALDIETSTPPESDEWLNNQTPPDPDGVDVLGSELTGLSMTFGSNLQYTVYISVEHAQTSNVTSEEVRRLVAEIPQAKNIVIQNVSFELSVLYQEWSAQQEDNGWEGFLPNVLDTKLEASYVDENDKTGLKNRSKRHLGYTQQAYQETCTESGPFEELRPGGRLIRVVTPKQYFDENNNEVTEEAALALDAAGKFATYTDEVQERLYKMRELPATKVFSYGCDDTICTAALHNFYRLSMELEHHWQVYLETEIDAAYLSAVGFLQGTDFSAAEMRKQMAEDDKTYNEAWAKLRDFLMTQGWAGTVCPTFSATSTPSELKEAFRIITGRVLDTQVRKTEKLAKLIEAEGEDTLAALLLSGDWAALNKYVANHFKGEPEFNINSPKQKEEILYNVLKLPVRMRNAPTDAAKANGVTQGSVKTDVLAIDWAIKFDAQPEQKEILQALKLMQMVTTRYTLYYNKYIGLLHWKTGKLHSQLNQCEANTRRSSEKAPNKQQLPKHQKIEGQPPKFRRVVVPHREDAVIVSLDEDAQELRIIADYSQDPEMLACFIGENKKKMHALTGVGIAKKRHPTVEWTYELLMEAYKDKNQNLHAWAEEAYALGKKVNFTTEYGAQKKKLSETLLESEDDAQAFIDAKEKVFFVASEWKNKVIEDLRRKGYVKTKMGAVRHLRDALNSYNAYEASKAERQGVNMKIQGSAAEQTKKAYGEAWKRRLPFKYDCVFIGPVHDEVVWSVKISDLFDFLVEMHACMVQPYGGMTVPIESSISFGPSFGEQFEIGNRPVREAVAAGLGEMVAYNQRYKKFENALRVAVGPQVDTFKKAYDEAQEAIARAAA